MVGKDNCCCGASMGRPCGISLIYLLGKGHLWLGVGCLTMGCGGLLFGVLGLEGGGRRLHG